MSMEIKLTLPTPPGVKPESLDIQTPCAIVMYEQEDSMETFTGGSFNPASILFLLETMQKAAEKLIHILMDEFTPEQVIASLSKYVGDDETPRTKTMRSIFDELFS